MIVRDLAFDLQHASTWAPSITLTGPRQSGKTTLCRAVFPGYPYRSLEAPDERAFAMEDPRGFLAQFPQGAVLDEVQRVPDLLSYLQGIIDADPVPGRWILSGSQNLALLESVSQSLAGRTSMHQLLPLSWDETRRFPVCPDGLEEAMFTGGYPRILDQGLNPADWLRSYVATYIERDVRLVGRVGDLTTFQRFVGFCAGRSGQLLNFSSLADDCGISQPTAKAWFSILEASFIAFHLPAFNANLRKRLVKMPKLYFYDTGLACWLLGIREPGQLRTHPLRGALFETWVVSEVLKHRTHRSRSGGLSFYRDSHGMELDLLIEEPDVLTLIEAKSAATPKSSLLGRAKRIRTIVEQIRPRCDLVLIYGGSEVQQRSDSRIVPWRMVRSAAPPTLPPTVQVFADGQTVARAHVVAILPDKTWESAQSDGQGCAKFDLHPGHLPLTVFVAKEGFGPHVEAEWTPDERALHVQLTAKPDGGSHIAIGVNPDGGVDIMAEGKRIAIGLQEGEGGALMAKRTDEPGRTEKASGHAPELLLDVVKVVGDVALLEYVLAGPFDETRPCDD